jgi:2-polyprenyl-3-methyl-5-hydroxy-6-metoxy-1,4-benzoquinol methylase
MNQFMDDQREFFDRLITEQWHTYNNRNWDRTRRLEVRKILEMVPGTCRVLNMGCGCGFHDALFAESAHVDAVVGIDYSPNSIEQANRHYPHPKVQRVVMDINQPAEIVRRFGLFDLVVSFQVLEHLSQPAEFISSSIACARDGGVVAFVTPNRETLQNRVRRLAGKPIQSMDPLHFREFTRIELEQALVEQQLEIVGSFGHSLGLTCRGRIIIVGNSPVGMVLGQWMPGVADVLGIVARKRAVVADRQGS